MGKELKIDEDRVREAMDKCPDAKEVLKTLFPDLEKREGLGFSFFDITGDENSIVLRHAGYNVLAFYNTGRAECKDIEGDITNPIERDEYVWIPFRHIRGSHHKIKIRDGRLIITED